MMPDRARIEQLVPHAGAMCLLDAVTQWDAAQITCSSHEPGASHPLVRDGVVPAIAAAEYAAQAAAVHGALLDGTGQPRAGMLAKLMDVDLPSACFPPGDGSVTVSATLLSRSGGGCLYAFEVGSRSRPIASGRLIVAFATSAPP
jgi:predicted hotdog family 3-hydroxylacyl-ACP dehydratase